MAVVAPEEPSERPGIVVASDQSLVAESVRAALVDQGYDAVILRWPSSGGLQRPHPGGPPPELALLLSALDRPSRISTALRLLTQVDAPWVVLAGVDAGPAWGAFLEAGVAAVMPTSTSFDQLTDVLQRVQLGEEVFETALREELVEQWRGLSERRQVAAAALAAMTARETEVLYLLHAGATVHDIALRFDVSEATVRSQVKAVLRKLGVNTQLAAVAALELMIED